MKRLIKIYQDNAVFLINNNLIVVEKITGDALEILDFYNKLEKNYIYA